MYFQIFLKNIFYLYYFIFNYFSYLYYYFFKNPEKIENN